MNIIILAILIIYIIREYSNLHKIINISLSLILSGGISNLIDRLFRGYVIDYININNLFKFPIFNIADIFVVVGITIIIINILVNSIKKQENV